MDIPPFPYMAWAKEHVGRPEIALQTSGLPAVSLEDLGISPAAVRLDRPVHPGPDPEVAAAVSRRYRVPAECVMPCCGTHLANFLVARTLAGPGTRVLVESPTYEDLPGVFRVVGAEVRTFRRSPETAWRLPVPEIRAGLADGARIVAVSDLHNPGGARLLPEDLAALEAAGREFGAKVLVDEVYRDFLPPPVGTSFLPGGPFVVTSSLTKVYGLPDLRIGWALADPGLVLRMRDLHDYLVVSLPAPSASVALAAWDSLDAVAGRHREIARRGLLVLRAWVRGRRGIRWSPPDGGISAFLEVASLRGVDDVAWAERLLEETGVLVAPGSMFGAPGSIRVSYGLPAERVEEGLRRLGEFLDGGSRRG